MGYSISAEDWAGYILARGFVAAMESEERINIYREWWEKEYKIMGVEKWDELPEKIKQRIFESEDERALSGLEAVHRMLLEMKDSGAFKVLEDETRKQIDP